MCKCDISSVKFLENFDIPVYKVASACLTDYDLLDAMAETDKPLIISTGMSTLDEIHRAVDFVDDSTPFILMATTSTYPCKIEELNLRRIMTLEDEFDCDVGYSGHEVGLWTTLAAVAMGAVAIERHITLDRSLFGSDQSASVEPDGFRKLVSEIRDLEKAMGDGKVHPFPSELPILEKLRRVK